MKVGYKKCKHCGEEKAFSEFSKDKSKEDGLKTQCKSCVSLKQKNKRRKSRYGRKASPKDSRIALINKLKSSSKEEVLSTLDNYSKKEILEIVEYLKDEGKASRERQRLKYETDPLYRKKSSLRNKMSKLHSSKSKEIIELVGCSPYEFWEMNGSPSEEELRNLHIDHIIPLSWFDLDNEDHVKVCCHYLNLQYLPAKDNLHKNNSYMGSPDNILAYKEDFDIDAHVSEMLVIIDSLN